MIPYTENKKGNELDPITIGNDKYVLIAHPSTGVLYKCLVSELASFVGVGGGNFIPLAGTTAGNPVTGEIEFDDYVALKWNVDARLIASELSLEASSQIKITCDQGSRGIVSERDYTANITDLDYTQKKYVDGVIEVGSDTNEYIKRKDASGSFYWVPVLRALP